ISVRYLRLIVGLAQTVGNSVILAVPLIVGSELAILSIGILPVCQACGDDLIGQNTVFFDNLADINILNWMIVVAEGEFAANGIKFCGFHCRAEGFLIVHVSFGCRR